MGSFVSMRILRSAFLLLLVLLFFSCHRHLAAGKSVHGTETGLASYYGGKYEGRKTANGETFHTNDLTAAHKTLPFGTRVKVTNLQNGKTVKVRINDRGPFVAGRIIDLTPKAAKKIDMINAGVVKVRINY
jgi:rare lipoprotein A